MRQTKAWRCVPLIIAALMLLGACSKETPQEPSEAPSTANATAARATGTATGTAPATGTTTPGPSATPLSQQQLDRMALSATDLPAGFAVTASGPGGPELGTDVLSSYQEEFQQRDVTSTQALQQTIVIINLLGQYRDAAGAVGGIRAINVQSLNQLLGSVNLNAEVASVPAIAEDSEAFHFTGDSNGVPVGGYLIVFHKGPIASLLLTAAVKGSESQQQAVDLAQKQAQKIPAA